MRFKEPGAAVILAACFSHMPAVPQGSPYCVAPGPRTASQSLSGKDSSQLIGQSWLTSQRLYWVSLRPRAESQEFPRHKPILRTAAASLGSLASSLQVSGKEWKNPSPDRKCLNDELCLSCPNPWGIPAWPCLVVTNLNPSAHTP